MTVKLRDLLQAMAEAPGTSGSALASRFGVTRANLGELHGRRDGEP